MRHTFYLKVADLQAHSGRWALFTPIQWNIHSNDEVLINWSCACIMQWPISTAGDRLHSMLLSWNSRCWCEWVICMKWPMKDDFGESTSDGWRDVHDWLARWLWRVIRIFCETFGESTFPRTESVTALTVTTSNLPVIYLTWFGSVVIGSDAEWGLYSSAKLGFYRWFSKIAALTLEWNYLSLLHI